ncbi:MAG: BrnT family toxin [Pigmentiphaga sp.]|nr:BrnT family toxin [Pigmentiphaga sp.]
MSRLAVRVALGVLALMSAGSLAWQAYTLASNPAVHWLAEKPIHHVRQALTKAFATAATPGAVDEALGEALAETPADWPVIEYVMIVESSRKGELRSQAMAYVFGVLAVLSVIFVPSGDRRRVISFRPANQKERSAYHAWLENHFHDPE